MQSKTIKKIEIIIIFIVLIYGIQLIYVWNSHQQFYKEGYILAEIGRDDLSVGEYVSFYIDDYINKETQTYLGNEYDIYTVLIERKTSEHEDIYIQVMAKEQETKQKLNNKGNNKVYFQGEVISAPFGGFEFNKDIHKNTDEVDYYDVGKLILNEAIIETEVPDEGYKLYLGIALVILSLVVYRLIGGIESCVPDVKIKSNKYDEYNFEYYANTHNMENELLCEKDNLISLQREQIVNKKVSNILCAIFAVGFLLFVGDATYFRGTIIGVIALVIKMFGCILMFISIGGVWSRFINSSHKLAVYIAHKFDKRSIHLEIETCKKNIEYLERIMEEKNIN
ncbi:MAG: hypothetical protein IJD58_04865 [Lachnospiraceae bacterium]|nr:hypothetical protein [Lachnospiraceae bacterium]